MQQVQNERAQRLAIKLEELKWFGIGVFCFASHKE